MPVAAAAGGRAAVAMATGHARPDHPGRGRPPLPACRRGIAGGRLLPGHRAGPAVAMAPVIAGAGARRES